MKKRVAQRYIFSGICVLKRSFNAETEGSVIKHQLVTHLMLGIALRAVLDTLRKPEDSKMIFFGTEALEQFVDRLIGWPQYRNHILHFVAFIERALNKILASHTEPDVGHSVYTNHRLGFNLLIHIWRSCVAMEAFCSYSGQAVMDLKLSGSNNISSYMDAISLNKWIYVFEYYNCC
ncbi:uncharacterized protein LOC121787367 [Salvia splendens]|uniref:uncharacterized protein LOC121787367 n=1 Tax=Salvia splendens TaxID=180675 RepID=UPI001C262157|nr:uncharacterized protein LOC121787367 [Salvia splendens]